MDLDVFWPFFPNLIINLATINLTIINLTLIKFISVTFRSIIKTNPDYILPGLCQRINTLWSFQYRDKWCSYWNESLDELAIKVCKSEEHLNISYWLVLTPLLDYLDSFVLYADVFREHFIAKEPNFFLMKSILLQVSKQREFTKFFQNQPYNCNVTISIIVNINKKVVQINDNNDIKLLSKNLVNVFLEACWCVC